MSGYYDDNFGHWDDMEDPENVDFYRYVQSRSVLKVCSICECEVRIMPQYDKCNDCADRIESGMGY